jgi:hypothetical protein
MSGLYEADSGELTNGVPSSEVAAPVTTKTEAIDTTATVAAVKAAVRAKRTLNVVDVAPAADALPPPPPTPEPPPLTDADFVPTAVRP